MAPFYTKINLYPHLYLPARPKPCINASASLDAFNVFLCIMPTKDYIISIRWPDGFLCPRCGHNKAWPIGDALFQCTSCRYRTSIIAGTIFQDTHKPLTMWFRAMWWVAFRKSGASALGFQKVLGLGSYETAWSWRHKIRHAMVRPGREKLSGFVEVDDTYICGEHEGKQG